MNSRVAVQLKEKTSSLVEDFQQYFALELVTTQEQLESVYRIRYRVYCEEFGYEPSEAFPSHQEEDEFDANASHCLVRHKTTGMPAGCARLVHADESSLMPMEKYCGASIDQDMIRQFDGARDTVCELSRLAVDGAFRRRSGERATRFGEISSLDISKREQRTFSLLALSSILAALAMSDLIGRTNCFAMMERFLPRLIERSGLIVQPAGTEVDYHGLRAPYFWETNETLPGMAPELLEFYCSIRKSFEKCA